jgi:hypothetical protein
MTPLAILGQQDGGGVHCPDHALIAGEHPPLSVCRNRQVPRSRAWTTPYDTRRPIDAPGVPFPVRCRARAQPFSPPPSAPHAQWPGIQIVPCQCAGIHTRPCGE